MYLPIKQGLVSFFLLVLIIIFLTKLKGSYTLVPERSPLQAKENMVRLARVATD